MEIAVVANQHTGETRKTICYIDAEGYVGSVQVDIDPTKLVYKSTSKPSISAALEKNAAEEKPKKPSNKRASEKGIKRKQSSKATNEEATDSDVNMHTGDEDVNAVEGGEEGVMFSDGDLLGDYLPSSSKKTASLPLETGESAIKHAEWHHPRFQPNATAWRNKCRIMAWNSQLGMIVGRREGNTATVEVEFHDKRAHRPVRFMDEVGWEMAALSENGLVLAAIGLTASLMFMPLQSKSNAWTVQLPSDEPIALACTALHIAVATRNGMLHILTATGVPVALLSLPCGDDLVSMCIYGTVVALFSCARGRLACTLVDFKCTGSAETSFVCSASRERQVGWVGFSEEGMLAVFDGQHLLAFNGLAWIPALRMSEPCWPVHLAHSELHVVLPSSMPEGGYPDPYPTPLLSPIPLCMPLLSPLPEAHLLSPSLLNSALPTTTIGTTDRERKKTSTSSDKHLLELIQVLLTVHHLTLLPDVD